MKQIILTLLLIAFSRQVFAQLIPDGNEYLRTHSSIYVQTGPSLPLGAFKNNDPTNDEAGFAKMGYSVNINYLYRLNTSFGLMADVRGRTYKQELSRYNRNNDTYTSKGWQLLGLNLGVYQIFPLSFDEKFGVQFREAAGIQFNKTPEITTNLNGVSGSTSYNTNSVWGASFSYLIGLGFHYAVSDKVKLRVFADYNGSNASFNQALRVPRDYDTQNLRQKIATLETGLGVGFEF